MNATNANNAADKLTKYCVVIDVESNPK